jgi:hypothetical protein
MPGAGLQTRHHANQLRTVPVLQRYGRRFEEITSCAVRGCDHLANTTAIGKPWSGAARWTVETLRSAMPLKLYGCGVPAVQE